MAEAIIIHTIKQGDTLSEVAKKHNVTVGEIQKANSIKDVRLLRIGMSLKIPKEINKIKTEGNIKNLHEAVAHDPQVSEKNIISSLKKNIPLNTVLGRFDLKKKFTPGEANNISIIKDAFDQYLNQKGLKMTENEKKMIFSYILATARHETAQFTTLKEITNGTRYNPPNPVAKVLGNEANEGPIYIGRGYVQITGENNYEKWSEIMFGRGNKTLLTKYKSTLLLNPEISAAILVKGMMEGLFTGRGLTEYLQDGKLDLVNARRTVNGTDKADLIASYARQYMQKIV